MMKQAEGAGSHVVHGWNAVVAALTCMGKNPQQTVVAMSSSALFLAGLGVVSALFTGRVVDTLLAISAQVVPQAMFSAEQGMQAVSGPAVQGLILQAIVLVGLFAWSAVLLFCVLEGWSWRACFGLAGCRQEIVPFLARFSRLSFMLFPAYMGYEILGFVRDFQELSAQRLPGLTVWNPSILVPISGVVLAYVCVLSFSSLGKGAAAKALRHAWNVGVLGIASMLPKLLPFAGGIAGVEVLTRFLLKGSMAGSVLAAGMVLAGMTAAKVSLILLVGERPDEAED